MLLAASAAAWALQSMELQTLRNQGKARFEELETVISVSRRLEMRPHIGVRARLAARGAGVDEIVASATPSSFNALGFKGVGESGTTRLGSISQR